jgi:Mg-chelatase subunit ChlD
LYPFRLFPPKNKFILKALANNLEHPKFGTDTAAGIQAAREMISQQGRADAPEMIVVITDGRSTNPRNTIVQVCKRKHQKNKKQVFKSPSNVNLIINN